MNAQSKSVEKAVDSIQQRFTEYAAALDYNALDGDARHAAKVRIIDTLGALVAGFFGESSLIAREVAAACPDAAGATVIGTRMKTTPDVAAFANAAAARYPELTDSYHAPGSAHGHASDTIMPVLAAGEHAAASGRDFITAVVLAYEVFLRISDKFKNPKGFDNTNFAVLGTSMGAGKLFKLSREQLAHALSMAAVPNVVLHQVRVGDISMFKAVASGQAGRAGVFAAMLARAGMEGPHLPFEGKAGWCDHVAGARFTIDALGGRGTPFKILQTQIKTRPSSGETISTILAGEKIAPLTNVEGVERVVVEVNKYAKDHAGTHASAWEPMTREAADHSVPYTAAVALVDGTVTLRSFKENRLFDPAVRGLMKKVEVVSNDEFSKAFDRMPVEHHTRITVVMKNGERLVGAAGGDADDMGMPRTDAQINEKFRSLTDEVLGAKRTGEILDRLWHLEECSDVSTIPPLFTMA